MNSDPPRVYIIYVTSYVDAACVHVVTHVRRSPRLYAEDTIFPGEKHIVHSWSNTHQVEIE